MKSLMTVIVILTGALVATSWFVWSGTYNIAATKPHSAFVKWLFTTLRDHSIAYHSKNIKPPDLGATELMRQGAVHYDAMCAVCHRAPGQEPSEISKGLNPPAPELRRREVQMAYSDSELFWIIKHGIRMTGMPAFGPTHDDDDLWAIVAFTRRLPEMQSEDYKLFTERPLDKHR